MKVLVGPVKNVRGQKSRVPNLAYQTVSFRANDPSPSSSDFSHRNIKILVPEIMEAEKSKSAAKDTAKQFYKPGRRLRATLSCDACRARKFVSRYDFKLSDEVTG
jgi:hypothetical protein